MIRLATNIWLSEQNILGTCVKIYRLIEITTGISLLSFLIVDLQIIPGNKNWRTAEKEFWLKL